MPARPPVPVPRTTRIRARWGVCAGVAFAVIVLLAMGASMAPGASSGTVVGAVVPSATTLDGAGCAPGMPGVTEFGNVLPTTTTVTTSDCVLVWGSSNATSMLRTFQSDAVGSAMGAAATTWASKSTRDVGGFEDISAASTSTAYAAGGGAGVRYTTTGGSGWAVFDPGANSVRDVAVVPGVASTAVFVGDNGMVNRTTTTGGSWPAETSSTASTLRAVSMSDATNGYAVGDAGRVIRRTTAGGTTWSVVTSAGAQTLQAVSAFSPTVVFVAGTGGALYRSDTSGASWVAATGTCNFTFTDIVAVDANTAFVVGHGGRVVRAFWNGATFACTDLTSNANVGEDMRGVSTDGTSIFAVGVMGTLIRSNNTTAAATWSRMLPGTAADLGGVSSPSDGSIWVAGTSDTISSAPNGTTFAVVRVETTDSTTLTAVAGVSDTTAYVVGGQVDRGATWQAAIRKTANGGTSWTSQTSSTTNALFGVDAVGDGTIAYAAGDNGTIVQTTNGGTTWAAQSVAPAGTRLWDIDMVDEVYGWAVGDSGTIVRTSNGGTSWVAQTSGVTNTLSAVSAVDKDIAFAVGTMGRVLRTTNGGATWSNMTGIPTTQALDDVSAANAKVVWVAFGYQQLLQAANADVATPTWNLRSTGTGGDQFSIDTVGPNAVFAGAAWNEINRTRDGGTTWSTDNAAGSSLQLYGIDAIDENSAWGVGSDNGVVLTVTTPATAFGDYADAGPNWSSGTSIFAACLKDSTGTNVTPVWTVDASCTASGTGIWQGIPTTSAGGSSKIAGATTATNATTKLRFGIYVQANQAPGRYSAGLTFEVVAPNA
ncbi:MAG: hypothetical protein JWL76_743 [Thermoleophilia bacterium]|nr:hypothetical protein [Thermoleophilia bacterium]